MKEKTIYALGFFDGVHLGHRALLRACVSLAKSRGCKAGAVTFGSHPDALVHGKAPGLINTPADRDRLLRHFGIETVEVLPFDEHMRTMPWQDFFRLLVEEYGAAGLICGEDFRFGFRGEGSGRKLQLACAEAGIPCAVVEQQKIGATVVSSTHIRTLLEAGRIEEAEVFLGHPHILTGTVVSGRHLGRTIGVPTANLAFPEGLVVPKLGVYACRAIIGREVYYAVTNIGTRPTVEGHHVTVESWILDFGADLYGREITLEFYQFLRPEQKFGSLEDLRAQIQLDAAKTRQLLR